MLACRPTDRQSRSGFWLIFTVSLFDWYEPYEVRCPDCDQVFPHWQGRDGPNLLFLWRQDARNPVAHDVDDNLRVEPSHWTDFALPRLFLIQATGGEHHASATGDPAFRGKGGPVWVQPAADPLPMATAALEGFREVGLPVVDDLNGEREITGNGFAYMNQIIKDGRRNSMARAFLYPVLAPGERHGPGQHPGQPRRS